jgi:prevent-host-death family protein
MGSHSIAETKDKLSELIARAEKGEEITITRHGRPVVRLTPVESAPRRMTDADLDWLKKRRIGRGRPKENAGAFVSRMRDKEWVERLLPKPAHERLPRR